MAVATYDPPGTYSNACHAAIVEVDVETGGVRIERFVAVEDAGLLINPMIADGQVRGGIAQGIANALLEEIVYDDGRQHPHRLARRLSCRRPRAKFRRSRSSISRRSPTPRSPGPRASARAARSARRRRCSTRSPTRCARSASQLFEMPATPQRIRAAIREAGARRMTDRQRDHLHGERRGAAIEVEPRRTLADALRENCGLTGTHLGCEHGVCGACTVLVDGEPVRSCLMFAVQAEGHEDPHRRGAGHATACSTRCRKRSPSITRCNAASARRAS